MHIAHSSRTLPSSGIDHKASLEPLHATLDCRLTNPSLRSALTARLRSLSPPDMRLLPLPHHLNTRSILAGPDKASVATLRERATTAAALKSTYPSRPPSLVESFVRAADAGDVPAALAAAAAADVADVANAMTLPLWRDECGTVDPEAKPRALRRAMNFAVSGLYIAARNGDLAMVKALVEGVEGLDVNVGMERGTSPFLAACFMARMDVIRFFLDTFGSEDGGGNASGFTPLLAAAQEGHIDVAEMLWDEYGMTEVVHVGESRLSAVHIAACQGHIHFLQWLVARGVPMDTPGGSAGESALHAAASAGHVETVRWLVEEGGLDPAAASSSALLTPMINAVIGDAVDVVAMLHQEYGISLLSRSFRDGGEELERGGSSVSALQVAATVGSTECAKFVLEHEPRALAAETSARLHPLVFAVHQKRVGILHAILSHLYFVKAELPSTLIDELHAAVEPPSHVADLLQYVRDLGSLALRWTPRLHVYLAQEVRDTIFVALMIARSTYVTDAGVVEYTHGESCFLPHLPNELLHIVFDFIAAPGIWDLSTLSLPATAL